MPEQFTLPVPNKGEMQECAVTLIRLPYTYQLQVEVDTQKLFFEPDDCSEYRLIKMPWQSEQDITRLDSALIQTIIDTLNTLRI